MAAPKNIHSRHILTLGERTLLKLGVLSSLFIAYNIAISSVDFIHWIVPNFIFYCVTMHTHYTNFLSERLNVGKTGLTLKGSFQPD